MNKIQQLRQKLAALAGDMDAIAAAAEADSRDMTDEERQRFDASDEAFKATESEIARLERLEQVHERMASVPRPAVEPPLPPGGATDGTQPGRPGVSGGEPVVRNHANRGFDRGVGQFLMAVRDAAYGRMDPRLAVTTWSGEQVGADGGFGLPPQFIQGIMSLVLANDSFLRALVPFPTEADLITIPVDEDAPWASDGVQANKTAEGAPITASKIKAKQPKVVMHKVASLVHVDEKSLRDMSFLGAFVQRKMAEKIRWKCEKYVMSGTGENEPLGLLNAPGRRILSDAETTSTSTALTADDVGLMEASALSGPGGFWVAHPLVKNRVRFIKNGDTPLYTTDLRNGAPVDQMLGYPAFTSEAAKPYNTEGDLLFVKPDGFFLAFESGGPRNDTTIAFAFDQNLQSFRSTLYMGCTPLLSAPVLRADGVNYAGHIVTLAART